METNEIKTLLIITMILGIMISIGGLAMLLSVPADSIHLEGMKTVIESHASERNSAYMVMGIGCIVAMIGAIFYENLRKTKSD